MYIVVTQILNGTVTMDTQILGIMADNFDEAVKKFEEKKESNTEITRKDEKGLYFVVHQEKDCPFGASGHMLNEPIKVWS
jgi:hypothetical protein